MKSQVKIKNPCHANVSEMERFHDGVFCTDCNLKVKDFTDFTEGQLTKWISENAGKKACGIFRKEQVQIPFWNKFLIPVRYAAISVIAFFSAKQMKGQNSLPAYWVVDSDSSKIISVHGDTVVKRFYGHVTNEYGKPIPFTHIRADFNGSILADTLTRNDGSFELLVPFRKNQMITLMAENFDYVSAAVAVTENDTPRFRMRRHRHHLFRRKQVMGAMF